MGILIKRGIPYVSDYYQDPQDLLLKEKVAQDRREKEEKEKIKQEYFELKFEKWMEETPREEFEKLAPVIIGEFMDPFHLIALKDYFRENIFPVCEGQKFEN